MNVFSYAFVVSLLVPRVGLGGYSLLLEDLLVMLIAPVVFVGLLREGRSISSMPPYLKASALLIIFSILFFFIGAFQSSIVLGTQKLPTELWQMTKNGCVLYVVAYSFARMAERQRINYLRFVCLVLLVGLSVGIGQYLGFSSLSEIYARTEKQTQIAQQLIGRRVVGISGFAVSWGVFSAQAAIFFMISWKLARMFRAKQPFYLLAIAVLVALFNIISSGSRSVLVATSVVIVLMVLAQIFRGKWKAGINGVLGAIVCIVLWFVFVYMFTDQYDFLSYRFEVLSATAGGARVDQVIAGIGLLDSVQDVLFGISNAGQRMDGVSFGIEVEPVNLFVNYGLVGILMVYAAVYMIAVKSWQPYRRALVARDEDWYDVIGLHLLIWLFSMIASTGYFILQELVTGSLLWIAAGVVAASMHSTAVDPGRHRLSQVKSHARHPTSFQRGARRRAS